ncbi:peptidoglycan D,D-transpeptidase FtsI family protein [Bacillus carboniphilus]|uniref:peptidoglycan D,D-transpeptidase FtsI family protein n=1 Tax=Bacillus carboniphilus TaxID=86663 RepID=UPI003531D2E1
MSVPRGEIYDRNGQPIVLNEQVPSITYTRINGVSQKDIVELAEKLAKIIDKDTEKVTERDLKDYWIITRPEQALKKITDEELNSEKLDDKDLYELQLDRINEADLNEIDKDELEVVAIFREMTSGYYYTSQTIKRHATQEEMAIIAENSETFPGVDIHTDWDRKYTYDDTLRSILGSVSSTTRGLPKDELDYYLSKGYNRNDRVGLSQLEYQYEEELRGSKRQMAIEEKDGEILSWKTFNEGVSGKDLVLTIDIELQKQVEEIVSTRLLRAKPGEPFLDRAFVVMMNPKTGEVLSLTGKQLVKKDGKYVVQDYSLGTISSAYEMGSTVKGATILTGLQEGAISPATVFQDATMHLKGTPDKSSYKTLGTMNIKNALKRSSNVYMFKTVLAMFGTSYYPFMSFPNDPEVFDSLRYHFNQFGLGVKTGIDLPGEIKGLSQKKEAGKELDFSIGQYDTYTPMQLAQYVSTIANDGYRMKPHLVKQIRDSSSSSEELGAVKESIEPVVLNKVDMPQQYLDLVQSGFKAVYQEAGGTANYDFGKSPYNSYNLAGKTGTAQSFYYDSIKEKLITSPSTYNLTLVGYAPYDDPEIAFSIVVPYSLKDDSGINKYIGQDIIKAYFENKNKDK